MLQEIENLIFNLLRDFIINGTAEICLPNGINWSNFYVGEDQLLRQRNMNSQNGREIQPILIRKIKYKRKNSKRHFAILLYVLAEVHKNLLHSIKSTTRALYYDNIMLTRTQANVNAAVRDVCKLLQRPNWHLGIFAAGKGLVTGALSFVMTNGDIIDCHARTAPTLIPTDFSNVEHLVTEASFVLLVEKDTIFEMLIGNEKFSNIADRIVLVTGKGYPDISTRILINRLHNELSLPIYALFDADPYGMEILLVYRHGSREMSHAVDQLACPKIQWIGIHPSEIYMMMSIQTEMLARNDYRKIKTLLMRNYIDPSIRRELQIMNEIQRKAEIENFANFSIDFLLQDYILNKIKRNLVL